MENLSAYRYCIAMKKGRKILNLIVGCLMILISIIFITTTVFSCIFMQEFVYYTFLAIFLIIIPLPLFIFGIIGIVSATKRVEVYKGKVIYHIGFKNKEYRMSDIKTSKTKSETYRTGLDCRSWHRILGLARTSPLRQLPSETHLRVQSEGDCGSCGSRWTRLHFCQTASHRPRRVAGSGNPVERRGGNRNRKGQPPRP